MVEQKVNQISVKKHSRLGIASAIIAVVLPGLLATFIFNSSALSFRKGTVGNEIGVAMLLVTMTFPFLHLLGLILGLIGLLSKRTKKLYPIIGTLLNGLLLLMGVGLLFLIITNLSIKY